VIAFLEGSVVEVGAGRAVLSVNGVGYEVLAPASTVAKLPGAGKRAALHTRLVVRDDSMVLFGFSSPAERELFDMLTAVSGVGPKVALAFLSALTPDELRRAVISGDVARLTIVPGVGKKVAQRVALDLKDRLGGDVVVLEGPLSDVREALLALGLSPQEAGEAVDGLPANGQRGVEELLREALQRVGRS
jgi:holliday junction DNA helicase RuvA